MDLVPTKTRATRKKAPAKRDQADIARKWARRVMLGEIPVGKLLKAAVERQERDLKSQGTVGFPYKFDADLGAKACRFVERLTHIRGPMAGRRIVLEPWQCWVVSVGFGWTVKGTEHRRFRRFSWWMCRGQGKTILAAALSLFVLNEGQGAECVCAATSREQARLAFDVARGMVLNDPELAERRGFHAGKHEISQESTSSYLRPISAEAGVQEGGNYSYALLDELHAHGSRDLYDTVTTGLGKRPTSLGVVCSTAPTESAGIGYEVWTYARDILLGTIKDETEFAVIIAADEGMDPWSEATWRQANPGLGMSIDPIYLSSAAEKAKRIPSQRPAFFSRHLGWVVEQEQALFSMEAYDRCATNEKTMEECIAAGLPMYVGGDLAVVKDLCSLAFVFVDSDDEGPLYRIFTRSFLPQETLDEESIAAMPGWAIDGWLEVIRGGAISLDEIEARLVEVVTRARTAELAFDGWNAQSLVQHLDEVHGFKDQVLIVPQTVQRMSGPTKDVDALMLRGRLRFDANPLQRWAFSNVVGHYDTNDNIKAKKGPHKAKRIDPAIATIIAMSRAILAQPPAGSDFYVV